MAKRESAFFKAIGEAQKQAAEAPMLTLPTKAPAPAPAADVEQDSEATSLQDALPTRQQDSAPTRQQDNKITRQRVNKAASQQDNKTGKRERISKAGWLPQAIYLPPELRRKLRITATSEEREIGEIVAEALQEYFASRHRSRG